MIRSRVATRAFTIAATIAVVGALCVSSAVAAPPTGVSMKGTGAPPAGVGLFSAAALAQPNSADNGRMASSFEGGGPWCVNPWPAGKDNGGKTAPGVTATQVHIVAYVPNELMMGAPGETKPTNLATGQEPAIADVLKDFEAAENHAAETLGTYQLWGRTPDVEVVTATGSDEASQRADALEVIAKQPFMVIDMTKTTTGGTPVFSSAVAAKKIIVVSASTDAKTATAQAPYRWASGADPSSAPALTGAFVGKSLTGKKAQWAGDATLAGKARTFGLVYPTTGYDLADFEQHLTQTGGKLTEKLAYDPTTAQSGSAEIGTLISRLKSSNITSVILAADPPVVSALMSTATSQNYFPEWVYTGKGYQEWNPFARQNDQRQMAHAFGIMVLGPYIANASSTPSLYQWYWGSGQGNVWAIMSTLEFAYTAMHYAGPTLTASNVQKGLFAAPARKSGGTSIGLTGYGKTVGLPYDETASFGSDRALAWWDPDSDGPTQVAGTIGKGVFQYLNGGANVTYSQFTSTTPKFFDKSVSVTQVDGATLFPGGVAPTSVPCTGCPSSHTSG